LAKMTHEKGRKNEIKNAVFGAKQGLKKGKNCQGHKEALGQTETGSKWIKKTTLERVIRVQRARKRGKNVRAV